MSRTLADRALLVAGFIALAGLAWDQMAILGDGFWTIATGRWLFEHRALPKGDPFAFGSTGEWMIVSSGACVLFAKVADLVGLRGLMVMATLIEALAAWLVWARSARSALGRAALLPLAVFYVFVDAQDLSVRGQVLGDLALVLLLGALARIRDGRRLHPLLIFLLSAIWTNLHLSFLAAVVLPLFAAIVLRERTREYLTVAAAAAIGTCLNPYGPAYLRVALGTAFDSSTATLDLFRSPDFHSLPWLVAPALAVLLVGALARSRRPFGFAHAAFLLFFLAAACKSRRFATGLVAVEIGIAGPMLDALWAERRAAWATTAGAVAALGLGVALFTTNGWARRDPLRDVPARGAELARPLSKGDDVAAPLHWGGYLAYAWMGKPRYFIDGRDHLMLFGNGAFDDSNTMWRGSPEALALFDVYGVNVVIWEREHPLDALLANDPHWRRIGAGPIEVVYARVSP